MINGETCFGTWLCSGSLVACEIAGLMNFDWHLIDLEHGVLTHANLLDFLRTMGSCQAEPIIRIPNIDQGLIKHVLDSGSHGIMVPMVQNEEEVKDFVRYSKYTPMGSRGLTSNSRANAYSLNSDNYIEKANEELLNIVQIENPIGVQHAEVIVQQEGIDVLFVGPLDLTFSMNIRGQFDHPDFLKSCEKIIKICRDNQKVAGILTVTKEKTRQFKDMGFQFISLGVDNSIMLQGFQRIRDDLNELMT